MIPAIGNRELENLQGTQLPLVSLTDFGGRHSLLAQLLDLFLDIIGVQFQPRWHRSSVRQSRLGNTLAASIRIRLVNNMWHKVNVYEAIISIAWCELTTNVNLPRSVHTTHLEKLEVGQTNMRGLQCCSKSEVRRGFDFREILTGSARKDTISITILWNRHCYTYSSVFHYPRDRLYRISRQNYTRRKILTF